MKILFFGDSITDAGRKREDCEFASCSLLGFGYVNQIAGRLYERSLDDYEVINRGISGNRIVDLYARIKKDLWNLSPDFISILIGVNDIWHEATYQNGVEPDRFERVYRMLIEDTMERLPDAKLLLCAPFVLRGKATEERWEHFSRCGAYAEIVEKLAAEYGLYFLPLQGVFDEAAARCGNDTLLYDGVHPTPKGAMLLATSWMKKFDEIKKEMDV